MIKISREPANLCEPYENCVFCQKPTPYWFENRNMPVCPRCSTKKDIIDLPTDEEYLKGY